MRRLSLLAIFAITATMTPAAAAAPLVSPGSLMHTIAADPETTLRLKGKDYQITREQSADSCSQGPAGTVRLPDGTRLRVMLTAGHCLKDVEEKKDRNPEVYVNTRARGFQKIGVIDKVGKVISEEGDENSIPLFINSTLNETDYGTVLLTDTAVANRLSTSTDEFGRRKSRPVVLTGIRDYPTLRPLQVSWANWGQPICKDGSRTARSCGVQIARTANGIWSWGLNYSQGDSGGNNYDPRTGEVLGITSMGLGPIGRAQPADAALENAYNIPSGTVNKHFQLAESTEPAEPLKSLMEEQNEALQSLEDQGLEPLPDFRAEFNREVAASQRAAAKVGNTLQRQAATGDAAGIAATLDSAGKQATAHADKLVGLGIASAIIGAL